jgi:hypothetical protein
MSAHPGGRLCLREVQLTKPLTSRMCTVTRQWWLQCALPV